MMKKIGSISAVILSGAMMLTSAMPASAQGRYDPQFRQRDQVITNYCAGNRGDRDCGRFARGGWSDRDYNNFYQSRRGNLDGIASGLFGFGFGALLGGALANGNNYDNRAPIYTGRAYQTHVNACYARFKSYDERTDSYLGYDGNRHICQL